MHSRTFLNRSASLCLNNPNLINLMERINYAVAAAKKIHKNLDYFNIIITNILYKNFVSSFIISRF